MVTTSPEIILFDIDGTLISTHGAGGRAFKRALREQIGAVAPLDLVFAGGTDRALAREGLASAGLDVDEAMVDRVLERYLTYLEGALRESHRYTVFSGVMDTLDALSERDDMAVGLGTGNIERGARIKLAHGGLNDYFSFGGFGCDAADRGELIRAGAMRGAARLGASLEECRVVVVGDTTRDVAAAKTIGAECLAVTTGGGSREELMATGATHCVDSLADPRALKMMVGGR